jgi:alpha-beta hydrolase superfamily lysophospholipase
VLNEHAARGGLGEALPDALRIGGVPDVPTLVVHGAGDPVTPVATVREVFPEAELVTVVGGRHDILNDVSHRSVAATIVLFLERLRLGAPIVEPG